MKDSEYENIKNICNYIIMIVSSKKKEKNIKKNLFIKKKTHLIT